MLLEAYVKAAAEGVAKAVLDKTVEMLQADVKAADAKTDKGLFDRLKEKVKGAK
jgi:hypothetical protein